jgi:transcriptional regulator with XRE-family HTH domain
MSTLSEKVKEFRTYYGWTPSQLAQKVGCGPSLIQYYESHNVFPHKHLPGLATAFGVSTDFLLGRKAHLEGRSPRQVIAAESLEAFVATAGVTDDELAVLRKAGDLEIPPITAEQWGTALNIVRLTVEYLEQRSALRTGVTHVREFRSKG